MGLSHHYPIIIAGKPYKSIDFIWDWLHHSKKRVTSAACSTGHVPGSQHKLLAPSKMSPFCIRSKPMAGILNSTKALRPQRIVFFCGCQRQDCWFSAFGWKSRVWTMLKQRKHENKTGWWFHPLWKIWKSIGMVIRNNTGKWKKCSSHHQPDHDTQTEPLFFCRSRHLFGIDVSWKRSHRLFRCPSLVPGCWWCEMLWHDLRLGSQGPSIASRQTSWVWVMFHSKPWYP